MIASPRGLSQLSTSFVAYLRQGIHTHALSSLTIKFTLDTEQIPEARIQTPESQLPISSITSAPHRILAARRVLQLVLPINIQLSKIVDCVQQPGRTSQLLTSVSWLLTAVYFGGPG